VSDELTVADQECPLDVGKKKLVPPEGRVRSPEKDSHGQQEEAAKTDEEIGA
jgi:hypothetical protein